jgi:hypothetical protein
MFAASPEDALMIALDLPEGLVAAGGEGHVPPPP